jgi:hypothetical protein
VSFILVGKSEAVPFNWQETHATFVSPEELINYYFLAPGATYPKSAAEGFEMVEGETGVRYTLFPPSRTLYRVSLPICHWVNLINRSIRPDPEATHVMLSHVTDIDLWDKVMTGMLRAGINAEQRVYLATAVLGTSTWPTAEKDPRVLAIRGNPKVGNGTCTSIDECWEARQLVEFLDEAKITDPEAAVQWAIEQEGLHLEQGLNARWGEADDPQLKACQDFQTKSKGEQ